MACWNSLVAVGRPSRVAMLMAPADSPKTVTLPESPPKASMFSLIHCRAATWSRMPQLPPRNRAAGGGAGGGGGGGAGGGLPPPRRGRGRRGGGNGGRPPRGGGEGLPPPLDHRADPLALEPAVRRIDDRGRHGLDPTR